MNNKLIATIIGLAVCTIIVSSVLAPVIKDTSTAYATLSNADEALGYVEKIDNSSNYVVVWDMTDPEVMMVNGVPVKPYNGSIIMALDSYNIRFGFDTGSGYYVQSTGSTQDLLFKTNWPATGTSIVTFNFNEGVLNIDLNGSVTRTFDYTEGYVLSDKSNWVMKSPGQKAYLLDDSEIYANGRTNVNGSVRAVQIVGNVHDVDIVAIPYTAVTAKNIQIHADPMTAYNAYQLESITFDMVANDDESHYTACTYNYFVVPAEISAEKTNHLDHSASIVVAAIPVLVLVACLVYAVSVIRNRD